MNGPETWSEKSGKKFDPQGFYIWVVVLMFIAENTVRILQQEVSSAYMQLIVFYGGPLVAAIIFSFSTWLKKRVALCKFYFERF
jgi:hypothetical protein